MKSKSFSLNRRCKGQKGCSYVQAKSASSFSGEWVPPIEYRAHACRLARPGKFFGTKKVNGWELIGSHLLYCDFKYRLWVCEPGYLWDGPSYPPANSSYLGKVLRFLVGDRKKKGLLASSAQHDQMVEKSRIIQLSKQRLWHLKQAVANNEIQEFIDSKKFKEIDMDVHEAAHLYKDMLDQWPRKNESITRLQSFKQFLGLLLFQPWYKVFVTGPSLNHWEKIGDGHA